MRGLRAVTVPNGIGDSHLFWIGKIGDCPQSGSAQRLYLRPWPPCLLPWVAMGIVDVVEAGPAARSIRADDTHTRSSSCYRPIDLKYASRAASFTPVLSGRLMNAVTSASVATPMKYHASMLIMCLP